MQREGKVSDALWGFNSGCMANRVGQEHHSAPAFCREPSRRGVSSVSAVLYELSGHVTRPSAFQNAGECNVKMQNGDNEAVLDAVSLACNRRSRARENLQLSIIQELW